MREIYYFIQMKVGILYVAIGRYTAFWPEFYKSAQENLFPEAEKQFIVFSDGELPVSGPDVTVHHNDDMGWPLNTLMRYDMFCRIAPELEQYDYLVFLNGNCKIVRPLPAEEFLPTGEEDYCAMCTQTDPEKMTHEHRPESEAYVAKGSVPRYWAGGINGGKTAAFLALARECSRMAHADLSAGIMPLWHDESIVNKFLSDKHVKVLDRRMGRVATHKTPADPYIILRRKDDVLGRGWLRTFKGRAHKSPWHKLLAKLGIK